MPKVITGQTIRTVPINTVFGTHPSRGKRFATATKAPLHSRASVLKSSGGSFKVRILKPVMGALTATPMKGKARRKKR